jgi:hypothetical protein
MIPATLEDFLPSIIKNLMENNIDIRTEYAYLNSNLLARFKCDVLTYYYLQVVSSHFVCLQHM